MDKLTFYFDGSYIKASKDTLELFTPGRQCLHGAFETMRAVGRNVEFLDEHLDRLMAGLRALKVKHPYSVSKLKGIVAQVIKKNPTDHSSRVRVMVFQLAGKVHCLVMVLGYQASFPRKLKVCAIKTSRPAHARHARVKSLDYSLFSDANTKARSQGYDETLLINAKGYVFEASRANIFIRKKGVLITPPLSSGCLDGIIRRQVIQMARKLGRPVVEKNLDLIQIRGADHAFLTNSLAGLVPFDYN